MAARNPPPFSPLSQRSPTLSAVRSSPLASGTLRPYPVTASPFSSSPAFSFTQTSNRCTPSPDFFDDFTYSEDMDEDFRRIDSTSDAIIAAESSQANTNPLQNNVVFPDLSRNRKTWVVFRGKIPGVYDYCESAAMQTQGFSDAFQRCFPDRDAAELAWSAFARDGTYPDYGRSPWVIYLGQRPGVFTKVTELEGSVKGYSGAIFRSCSSTTEGKIKFQLFSERVAQMFDGTDPFSDVDNLALGQGGADGKQRATSAVQPVTPVLVLPKLPLALQVTKSWNTRSDGVAESSKMALNRDGTRSSRRSKTPHHADGWYVAHHAVLPGVYYGVETLKAAGPKPGGFQCALDKESADVLFHELVLDGKVFWVNKDE